MLSSPLMELNLSEVASARSFPDAVAAALREGILTGRLPAEAGLPLVTMTGWNMLFAPAGTPGSVVERLNRALLAALGDATVSRRMLDLGSMPASGERVTPDGAQTAWHAETSRWRPLLEAAGQYAD